MTWARPSVTGVWQPRSRGIKMGNTLILSSNAPLLCGSNALLMQDKNITPFLDHCSSGMHKQTILLFCFPYAAAVLCFWLRHNWRWGMYHNLLLSSGWEVQRQPYCDGVFFFNWTYALNRWNALELYMFVNIAQIRFYNLLKKRG